MTARRSHRTLPCCAGVLVFAALSIAACGRSAPTPIAATSTSNDPSSAASTTVQHASLGHDVVKHGVTTQHPMRGTGGSEINDDNPGRADSGDSTATGQNPCTLVLKARAQAIIGRRIATPQEAPLGPTCIYRPLDGKSVITVSVESIDFAKVESLIHHKKRVSVAGHTAYCGDYGRTATFVPLKAHRVLNVTAPCTIGAQFATAALPRLQT
jgi:hypothetical protein